MTTQTSSATVRSASGSIWRAALIALVASLVANHIIRLLALALLSPDQGFMALTSFGPVTVFTIFGVAGATAVYALLRRFTANPNRIFTIVAVVVLLVSLIPDIMLAITPAMPLPTATPATMTALALMHIATAFIVWRLFTGGRS